MHFARGITIFFIHIFLLFANQVISQTSKIDSLTNLLDDQKGDELIFTNLKLAKEYLYVSPDQTVEISKKVYPLACQSKNRELECLANLTLGSGMTFVGDFMDGKAYIDKGLAIAREINHAEYICSGLNALAVYNMNTGDYNKAISLFYECIDQAKAGNLEKQEAMIRFNVGAILTSMGQWSKGLKEFKYALEYFRKTGDDPFISRTLMNIAVNYSSWGDYAMSLSYYEKSLEHLTSVGDMVGKTSVLNNIGEIYKDTGEYQKALNYYQQALNIAIELKSKLHEAVPLIGKGEVYWLMKEYSLAEEFSKEALKIFLSMQMSEGIARSYHILGEVSLSRNNIEKSLEYAFKSKELADTSGIRDLQEKVNLLISRAYEKSGQTGNAFKYFKAYSEVKDSLFNQNHSQQLSQLRSDLELQDKEAQIEILRKDNQIKDLQIKKQRNHVLVLIGGMILLLALSITVSRLNKLKRKANDLLTLKNNKILEQHRELQKLNETKDMFFTIIGHDLRNPIGAFKDTLDQLSDYPAMFPEEVRKEVINELRNEASSTYFLLENMLAWAKSQKNNLQLKTEVFQINELIKNTILINSRFSENKKIKLILHSDQNLTVYADQNMVALVLRNLISNAIKFTQQGGVIQISAEKKDDKYAEISVKDNGIGISDELKDHLFDKHRHISTYGTNHEKGSGLGLMLSAEFIELNGGTISVESKVNEGSTFRFTLKLYKKG